MNWTAPAGNGGTPITGYDVFYGTSPDPTTRFGGTLGPSSRSVNVTCLLPNTLYYFEVKALNAAGSSAVLLYNVSGSTTDVVPGAPTGVTVTPGLRNLTLNWTVPSQNGGSSITGYHIYLVGSTGNSLVGNTTSETRYVISNLTPGSNLTYLITAVNVKGESAPSISVNGAALYPPEAPVDAKVVRDGSAILLTWNLTNGNASSLPTLGYAIYRGTSSGGEILIATVGASTTSYSDVNTSTSQTYYYRIGAVPGPGTVVDPQSMSPEVVQNGQTNGTDWTLIGGGVILLIALFLILFLVLISRRKKKKKEEGDPTKR